MFKKKYQENYLHYEEVKTSFLVIATYIIGAMILAILVLYPGSWQEWFDSISVKILFTILIFFDLVLFWSYSQLTIKLNDNYLKLSFGIFKKKINLKSIKSCQIEDYDKNIFKGYGFRFGTDKSVGFLANSSTGIRLKLNERDIYFSTNQPSKIYQIINSKIL